MKYICENNNLTVFLSGRIDSSNAQAVENEIFEILKNSHNSLVFDLSSLTYISSAGLRVILRVKKSEKEFKLIGVSSEVYDIFQMTGFSEMMPIERAYRVLSVEGCEIAGKGARGTVYRYNNDMVVKVYNNPDCLPDILNERRLARCAFVLGIPTAMSYDIVKVGDKFGSVFELLNAKSYSKLIARDSENRDKYIGEYVSLLKKIHKTKVSPDDMPDIKIFVRQWLSSAKPYVSEKIYDKIGKMLDEVPDTLNMLHCDYHTNNVMCQNGETILIDMDTLSHGHPVFELANIYAVYVGFGAVDKSVVENFLHMDYDSANYVWQKTLEYYFDGKIPEQIEDKLKLIAYLRILRNNLRIEEETENKIKNIELCTKEIPILAEKINSLSFQEGI